MYIFLNNLRRGRLRGFVAIRFLGKCNKVAGLKGLDIHRWFQDLFKFVKEVDGYPFIFRFLLIRRHNLLYTVPEKKGVASHFLFFFLPFESQMLDKLNHVIAERGENISVGSFEWFS